MTAESSSSELVRGSAGKRRTRCRKRARACSASTTRKSWRRKSRPRAAASRTVRTLAVELGPNGVRANAVAPGMVWTPRISKFVGEKGKKLNEENTPLGRVATPTDIASAILFLCSDLSSYVTGQTLVVDGGVVSKFPYPLAF